MSEIKNYALITGATSGIGLELAKLLAADGYKLILVARKEEELKNTSESLKASAHEIQTFAKDLSVRSEVVALCTEIAERNLQVDVLVNDAGQGLYGEFKDTDLDRELAIIDLNIAAVVILTKHFLKSMVEQGHGKILNLASVASTTPGPWQSVYHASKAFVLSFSEAVRYEVKELDITITALMPGATHTDFFNKADMQDSKMLQDKSALAGAAEVAKDGFEALMAGKDKVVSGLSNKIQVGMANLIPDELAAAQTGKKQEPANGKN